MAKHHPPIELTDLTHSSITSVSIDAATSLAGFSASDVSFDASHIFVNLEDLTITPTTLVQLDIETGAIPEPGSLVLLGTGLLGLYGVSGRRRIAKLALPPTFVPLPSVMPAADVSATIAKSGASERE